MKISVVIPVYNPGEHIEVCVDSLLRQTMPQEDFEVIFVDDGSTDETPAYLDDLDRDHANMTVIHMPNSGWPGKPRNTGIDAARGEFIFFCDNDDWLGDETLQRIYDFAVANESDILIPKMAGIGRPVPVQLFRSTRERASLATASVMDSLTPHKLFRRSFLLEHGIRFPEGRRRLEDHLFVVTAYLSTERIAIYSDYTCYFHIRRPDSSNAGFQKIRWDSYFANLAESLDVVEAKTEPGDFRDSIEKRWLGTEMVGRLKGASFTRLTPEEQKELFDAAHAVAARYFAPGVVARLPLTSRAVGQLLLSGDLAGLTELAEQQAAWGLDGELTGAGWVGKALRVSGVATYRDRSAADPALQDVTRLVSPDETDEVLLAALAGTTITVELTADGSGERWAVPSRTTRYGLTVAFAVDIDIMTAAGGQPLPDGVWKVGIEISVLGVRTRRNLPVTASVPIGKPRPRRSPEDQPEAVMVIAKKGRSLAVDVGLVKHPELSKRTPPSEKDGATATPAVPTSPASAETAEATAKDPAPAAAAGPRRQVGRLLRRVRRRLAR